MTDYGTITHQGHTITLTKEPYITARLLDEYADDLRYTGHGPTVVIEYAARGTRDDGVHVRVIWHHEVARHEDSDITDHPAAYPWDTDECDYDWDGHVYDVVTLDED